MGGIAKWVQRMLNSELQNGWSIELVDDRIVGERESFGDNVRYHLKDEIKRWSGVWYNLYKKARQKDAYVIHACPIASLSSLFANFISALIVKICRKKLLIHFRCTVPNMINSQLQVYVLKGLCRLSDMIICLNTQTVNYLESITKTHKVLIPNFVDIKECIIMPRRSVGGVKRVLYVGGVIKEKGCDLIVEIAKEMPDIQFRLVGLASSEIINQTSEVENIVLTGIKSGDELQEEYQCADVFLFLSRFKGEGFSNSLVEAMGAGLPCIVTDWAANADQVEDGKGGFVVGEDVINDVKKALLQLSSKDLRVKMGDYNSRKAREEYCASVILNKYVECYDELKKDRNEY